MTMIERAARAAYEGHRERFNATEAGGPEYELESWEDGIEALREDWRQFIRDALKAMREPTEAMLLASDDAWRAEFGGLYSKSPTRVPGQRAMWRAMIDAALNEEEGK